MTNEIIESLVKYQFNSITCLIDGADNESYQKYRVRGNFDTVISNIKKINAYREKYGLQYP
jgi:sulfatase maturation enzyme AslB (radical SAM superfamily)